MHASKAKQGIHSLLPIGRQAFSRLQESRAPSCITVTWEDKHHHSKRPPFLLLPSAFYAEHDVIGYGISLWSVGLSCPSCVPSQLFLHAQSTHWWVGVTAEKALTLCKHCSAIMKTSLNYQHCFRHKSKT